jgi:hypothetical protein
LASTQKHSDKEIKRLFLDSFLIKIKREYNVKHYIWKAELQKNGNIHFHIIVDAYIHYKTIQKVWNEIQEKGGYISDFEAKHGHKEPNGTDVKSIKSAKIVSIYISKYITKKEKYSDNRTLGGRVWGCSDSLRNIKYYEKVINTKIWENHEEYNDTDKDFYTILNEMRKMDKGYRLIEINEFTEIHCFSQNAIDLYKSWSIEENRKISKFYEDLCNLCYN